MNVGGSHAVTYLAAGAKEAERQVTAESVLHGSQDVIHFSIS